MKLELFSCLKLSTKGRLGYILNHNTKYSDSGLIFVSSIFVFFSISQIGEVLHNQKKKEEENLRNDGEISMAKTVKGTREERHH